MPRFETTRYVRHAPRRMLDLVMDVERYPEFLPLCEDLVVRERSQDASREIVLADMTIGYKALRETFRSRVEADADALTIVARYVDGPVRHLENHWRFEPARGDTCAVHFRIEYEFSNLALKVLMGAMFDKAFRKFAVAFERRADALYGAEDGLVPDAAGG